jgi:hypothetical protein
LLKSEKKLHPAEISHMQSKKHARAILNGSGFDLADYGFGINDLFVQAVIVGKKSSAAA